MERIYDSNVNFYYYYLDQELNNGSPPLRKIYTRSRY